MEIAQDHWEKYLSGMLDQIDCMILKILTEICDLFENEKEKLNFEIKQVSSLPYQKFFSRSLIKLRMRSAILTFDFLLFFRCNNVLYVRGTDEDNEDGEMRDE